MAEGQAVEIKFPDSEILVAAVSKKTRELGVAVDGLLKDAAALVERTAKTSFRPREGKRTPNTLTGDFTLRSQTGQLRRSISTKRRGKGFDAVFVVAPSALYGSVHEFGLGRMPARPFMRPSLDRNMGSIRRSIQDGVARVMRGGLK